MAYLRHFEIESEDKLPSDGRLPFRATVYHIKAIFLYFLPEKLYIDGSSKFQITLCTGQGDFETRTMLGSTEFKIGYFDFGEYFSLSPQDQEAYIVALIRTTFIRYCGPKAPAIAEVELALNKVVEVGYQLRYEVTKLRKSLTPMKLKIRVFRILSRDVQEAWWAEVERNGAVAGRVAMCKSTLSDRTGYYKRALIADGRYIVHDGFDRVAFSMDLEEFSQ